MQSKVVIEFSYETKEDLNIIKDFQEKLQRPSKIPTSRFISKLDVFDENTYEFTSCPDKQQTIKDYCDSVILPLCEGNSILLMNKEFLYQYANHQLSQSKLSNSIDDTLLIYSLKVLVLLLDKYKFSGNIQIVKGPIFVLKENINFYGLSKGIETWNIMFFEDTDTDTIIKHFQNDFSAKEKVKHLTDSLCDKIAKKYSEYQQLYIFSIVSSMNFISDETPNKSKEERIQPQLGFKSRFHGI